MTPRLSLFCLATLVVVTVNCSSSNTSGFQCETWSIPVTLTDSPNARRYTVRGELCYPGEVTGRTTQFLSHGAGYGPSYWDFRYRPEVYSYVQASLEAGYATFNFARLGVGLSDRPPAADLSIETAAKVLHQVIEHVRNTMKGRGTPLGQLVNVGHSMGSVITIAHGGRYPDDVSAIVLTGFVHHVNGDYVRANIADQVLATDDPRFENRQLGAGYISSSPAGRRAFYYQPNAEASVIDQDYQTREPVSLNQVLGIRAFYDGAAAALKVPVLEVVGDHDFIGCGTDLNGEVTLDCTDANAVVDNERSRFSEDACLETVVIKDAGHVLNLQLNATATYGTILSWLDRRIGIDETQRATEPCSIIPEAC